MGLHGRSDTLRFRPFLYALIVGLCACQSQPVAHASVSSTELALFREWMMEARDRYPYNQSVEKMWKVMLCESGGRAKVAGRHHGLFQYNRNTWNGNWNPYRQESIYDPRAQIFATAKAWSEGRHRWWSCY